MKKLFLTLLLVLAQLSACGKCPFSRTVEDRLPDSVAARRLTTGPRHHFASAYYHYRTLNASGNRLLCLETDLESRNPEPGEAATLGLVDIASGRFTPLAETRAWNFQQGAMQQWLGSSPDTLVTYNDFREGRFVAVIRNVWTGEERLLDRPLAAVTPDGRKGLSINFARLQITRLGYGYAGPGDNPRMDDPHPAEDGLWVVDLASGESSLIVSLDSLFKFNPPDTAAASETIWINHTMFNTDGTRALLFGRSTFKVSGTGWATAVYTVNPDGSDLRIVLNYDWSGSHYDWLSPARLMVVTNYLGKRPLTHLLFTDSPGGISDFRMIGAGILTQDGHGTFSPSGRWMVTDTYPDGFGMRTLMLLRMEDDAVLRLGRFQDFTEKYRGPARCDLHPRFQGGDSLIVFDSVDDGTRQVYVAELFRR